ncbi:MAG: potassium transporter Kup [Dokdonella sp.]
MSSSSESGKRSGLAAICFGALGVVYGDIGTSPLYAFKEAFGQHGVVVSPQNVFGVLSLIFWSLILVVSVKYATFIMRADNKGEGGIMALMSLAQRGVKNQRARWWIMALGLFGAALFFGDGVITPAISVLSAVEGLKIAAPSLEPFVIPITVVVIIGLFWIQKRGTDLVGKLFGPVTFVWFATLAALGVHGIAGHPEILKALSPHYAVGFFVHNGKLALFAMGAVVLAVTGAEALYTDMGHFGRKPIRITWFAFVLPCLMLNYLGQGALVLADPRAAENPFYRLVPEIMLYPMIALATAACVIASQAVISGAFTVTRQAIQLGYIPRMRILHTSSETIGQVFLPWINRTLMILTIAVVIGFKSSTNLAAAYGIAVVGCMTIDSLLVMIVARRIWHWKRISVIAIGVLFLTVDLGFVISNADKIVHGGWFPLALGVVVFTIMSTWRRGKALVSQSIRQSGLALAPFIQSISAHPPVRVPGTAIFMTANRDSVPNALLHNLKHNKVLHERNVLLTVETLDTPYAESDERTEVSALAGDFYQLTLRFGFAEDQFVPAYLQRVDACGEPFDMMDTTFFVSRESIVAVDRPGMALWRDRLFAFLGRNALSATAHFKVPGNRLIELGTQVEI